MPSHLKPVPSQPFERFLTTSLDSLFQQHAALDPAEKFLDLFQYCALSVPAYQQFLAANDIDPQAIKRHQHWQGIPLMSKVNYMQVYALPQRCAGGTLAEADRVAVSSGSTGQPTIWPRSATFELDVATRFEQVFLDSFAADTRTTLTIVCFALGNWVGGMYTTSCCWQLVRKGYPLMVATPGNNLAEILRIVKELAPHYQQTVLLGYPPFIKDVIDAGSVQGIDWAAHQLKLVFAGEVFSEEWRARLLQHTGSTSPCFDSASLYGTADGGVLGNETPFSIAIRRWLAAHPAAARSLFGESRLPTLVQYDPVSRFFETHEGTLVVSAENSVPLVRYHIADQGGIIGFEQMCEFLSSHGVQAFKELGLPLDYFPRELPFVFVFGRADFTVSYYGANIYPENVSVGLEQTPVNTWTTGKFVLATEENESGDKFLQITVELLPEQVARAEMSAVIATTIHTQLLRLNSEFAHYVPTERQLPNISLCRFGDAEYFPIGVKHRYTRK